MGEMVLYTIDGLWLSVLYPSFSRPAVLGFQVVYHFLGSA